MAIVMVGNIEVVVRTRDEHCPPHVHADCSPEGWNARFKFDFVSNDVEFWDFQPTNPRKIPSRAKLDAVGEAIFENLMVIRRRWWEVMGTVCLENRYVQITSDEFILVKRSRNAQGVFQVSHAGYDPETQLLIVTFTDGQKHVQNLGKS